MELAKFHMLQIVIVATV